MARQKNIEMEPGRVPAKREGDRRDGDRVPQDLERNSRTLTTTEKPLELPVFDPMAIEFNEDTTEVTPAMAARIDEISQALLCALEYNPALRIEICVFGEQPNTSAAGWEQSEKRLATILSALEKRGVPRILLAPRLEVEQEPELETHARPQVLIQAVPRLVPQDEG